MTVNSINVYRMTLEKENSGIDHCLLVARFQLTRSNTDAIREGLKTYIQSLVERKGKNLTAIEKNKCYARTQEEDLVDWFDEAERIRRYTMFGSWEDRAPRDRYTPMGLADIEAMIARIESELDVLTRTAP